MRRLEFGQHFVDHYSEALMVEPLCSGRAVAFANRGPIQAVEIAAWERTPVTPEATHRSEVDHRVARYRNPQCVYSVRNTRDEVGLADRGATAQTVTGGLRVTWRSSYWTEPIHERLCRGQVPRSYSSRRRSPHVHSNATSRRRAGVRRRSQLIVSGRSPA
jgi:hypothetical protein